MATVTLERIVKQYGKGAPAVDDVSFTVEDGEFVALLGPSGCGKSTTLRMIAGLENITGGKLSIDDRVVNNVPAKDRDIAMVFQSYALYPHMTVARNLGFGLQRRGFPREEINRRVNEAATLLGLAELLDRKPFSLSGGQRQRVALGRAIVRDPKVFLFDEPLSNLDASLRVSMRNEIVRQHQRLGTTMIYVTHDQVEAMTMSTRMCIMNKGKVMQVGKPIEVYRNPANTFVAAFLGSPPMNLVPATIDVIDGRVTMRIGGDVLTLDNWSPDELGAHLGKSVLFGIRPEHLKEGPLTAKGADQARISCRVCGIEPLGAETILLAELNGGELAARVGGDSLAKVGDRIDLIFDRGAVHLFDGETTKAIMKGGR